MSVSATVRDTTKYVFKKEKRKSAIELIIREEKLFTFTDNNRLYLIFNPIFTPEVIITVFDEFGNGLTKSYLLKEGEGNIEISYKRLERDLFFFITIGTDDYFLELPKIETK